jgi:hypothetical protein
LVRSQRQRAVGGTSPGKADDGWAAHAADRRRPDRPTPEKRDPSRRPGLAHDGIGDCPLRREEIEDQLRAMAGALSILGSRWVSKLTLEPAHFVRRYPRRVRT